MVNLEEWILALSEPRWELNKQQACPFAKLASIIQLKIYDGETLRGFCSSLESMSAFTVVIIEVPLNFKLDIINDDLVRRDLIALFSDPDKPVIVDGFRTTQTEGKLIIIQRLSELRKYREVLKSKGYFNSWSLEDLKKIGF